MAKWLVGQTAVITGQVQSSLVTPDSRFSVKCKVIALLAFMMPYLTHSVNYLSRQFGKIVNMP